MFTLAFRIGHRDFSRRSMSVPGPRGCDTESSDGPDRGKDRAIVVHVQVGRAKDAEARVAELRELCRTAGVKVLDVLLQRRPEPDPKFLVGRGKLDEILLRAMQLGAECVIFDPDLTPGQARAISEATELKVLDRTMLTSTSSRSTRRAATASSRSSSRSCATRCPGSSRRTR